MHKLNVTKQLVQHYSTILQPLYSTFSCVLSCHNIACNPTLHICYLVLEREQMTLYSGYRLQAGLLPIWEYLYSLDSDTVTIGVGPDYPKHFARVSCYLHMFGHSSVKRQSYRKGRFSKINIVIYSISCIHKSVNLNRKNFQGVFRCSTDVYIHMTCNI